MDKMVGYFYRKPVEQDEKFKDGKVTESAQHLYWRTFVKVNVYARYKEDLDGVLALEGHADIIVTKEPER